VRPLRARGQRGRQLPARQREALARPEIELVESLEILGVTRNQLHGLGRATPTRQTASQRAEQLAVAGIFYTNIKLIKPSLEDYFLQMATKRARR